MTGPQPIATAEIPGTVRRLQRKQLTGRSQSVRRDATACLLGLRGLRIGEVLALQLKHVDKDRRRIFVRTLKGGAPRRIPLDDELRRSVKKLIADAMWIQTPWLFHTSSGAPLSQQALRLRWSTWSKELFGHPIRFHDLRHTFARELYRRSDNNLLLVQYAMGHRSVQTTIRYLAIFDQLADFLDWRK